MADGADLEFLILSFLDQSEGPVGSGAICERLRVEGMAVSEATVGRFLRELDFRNYTRRSGFRGREITEAGRARVRELKQDRALAQSSTELMRAVRAQALHEVLDVLVVRRALEREAARLAAMNRTDEDLAALETMVRRYESADVDEAAEADFAFHTRLAECSGNRVLLAATQLIHAEAQSRVIPADVRERLKPDLSRQHHDILAAIRARDAQTAEQVMLLHLNGLIEAVQQCCPPIPE